MSTNGTGTNVRLYFGFTYWLFGGGIDGVKFLTEDLLDLCAHWERFRSTDVLAYS